MHVTIINRTKYHAKDLHDFCVAGLREFGANATCRNYNITFVPSRRRKRFYRNCYEASGYAWYPSKLAPLHAGRITMVIPPPEFLNMKDLAQVFIHEVGHACGAKHRSMLPWNKEITEFEVGRVIRYTKGPTKKTKTDDDKLKRCKARATALTTRIKRLKTLLNKWERKIKYYEKKVVTNERQVSQNLPCA
jgi:hypothetical protein